MERPHPSHYSRTFRTFEWAAIIAFGLLSTVLMTRLCLWGASHGGWILTASAAGYLAADFASGLVHWAGDTWGSEQTPLFGPTLIRPFREHHRDPTAILHHDFVETNGANCLFALPLTLVAFFIPLGEGSWLGARIGVCSFLTSLVFSLMATNQFHQWAHSEKAPEWVRLLQRAHLILSPRHHDLHHAAPFRSNYCITVGWLNPLLDRSGFFPRLERVISRWTGQTPRLSRAASPAPPRRESFRGSELPLPESAPARR
jgi:ubiquitin-conjugating enzyme E2 variant